VADLLGNGILVCGITAWLAAQVIKLLIYWRVDRKVSIRKLFSNGGMPSAHTAFVVAITIMVAFREGLGSTAFALSLGFTAIVINDAVGVRYETGKQGKLINKIIQQVLVEGKPLTDDTLKELVGHTPTEAFFGGVIGTLMPLFFR